MSATKLTLAVLAGAILIVGGCSNSDRIIGPGAEISPELNNSNIGGPINSARPEDDTDHADREYFTFSAKVQKSDIEGGCLFLLSENGETFNPVAPAELELEYGMKLKVYGYVDKNMDLFCRNDPAFVIEEFDILYRPMDDDAVKTDATGSGGLSNVSIWDEDRDPANPVDERDPRDDMDSEREIKKKYEEQKRSTGPSEDTPPSIVEDDNDLDYPTEERYEDLRDQERRNKKKLAEEGRSTGPNEEVGPPRSNSDDEVGNDLEDRDDGTGNADPGDTGDNGQKEELKKERRGPESPDPGDNG